MPLRDVLLALLVPTCFGIGFAMAKPAISHFPPLFLMLMIYLANSAIIGLVRRTPSRTSHLAAAFIALTAVTIQGALIFYGYRQISASLTTLIIQTQVPFAILLGWLLCDEAISFKKILGIAIAFTGVAAIVGLPAETPPVIPVFMVIGGGAIWSLGQVLARKFGRDEGIVLLRLISFHALPQLLLVSVLLERGQITALKTAGSWEWFAVLAFGIVGFFCGYSIWYGLLRRHRVEDVTPFLLLMPVIGVAVAVGVLGEPITIANLSGGALIIFGVALAMDLRPKLKPA
jgi:O-acetylserine/cysteine efflux transporter